MNNSRTRPMCQPVLYANRAAANIRPQKEAHSLSWLFVMILILLTAPKMRITIGPAPLYIIDVLILMLVVYADRKKKVKALKPLSSLVVGYLLLVWLGELRAMITYGAVLEPIYLIGRFSLGISMLFVVPRLVRTPEAFGLALKAIVIGLCFTSIVTIMYSLSFTRPLVVKLFFSHNFLVPTAERMARQTLQMAGMGVALRGQSLIGISTITTGFLGVMWGLTFLAAKWPGMSMKWRNTAHGASMLAPVAMLATYGRAAWLTVIVIGTMSFVFGFAKSRSNMVLLAACLAVILYQVGWQSERFKVDMIMKKTDAFIVNPYEAESERFGSFVEPFTHCMEYPSWLIIGAGRVGSKLSQRGNLEYQLRDVAGLSNHSGFGMAYYCYGLVAAVIHVLIIFYGFKLIWRRLGRKGLKKSSLYVITWQSFLMAWLGIIFWWLPGHAMIGEGRGVILFFFFYGFMVAMNNFWDGQEEGVKFDAGVGGLNSKLRSWKAEGRG